MKAKKVFIYDVALIKTPLEINKSFNKEKELKVLCPLTKRKNLMYYSPLTNRKSWIIKCINEQK